MRAFVTGGTGFLGYHIIVQLLDRGWEVTAMHRPSSDTRRLNALNVQCVEASLEDPASLVAAVAPETDAVFHVAGNTNMWSVNNARQTRDNVDGTLNIVDAALERRVKRLIHTSSISAYGFHRKTITESSPSTALDSGLNYMRTKCLGESIVKRAATGRGMDAVILNPCAIVGSHDPHGWSRFFVMIDNGTLPGIPPGANSFCHAGEVAKAHVNAFEKGRCGENYILSGINASFLELVRAIGRILDKPVPHKTAPAALLMTLGYVEHAISLITRKEPTLTPEKARLVTSRRVLGSSDKAARELGYNPSVPLERMLQECCQWMRQEGLLGGYRG
jgi:nucleoside-diphosphate-sugar epimerase